MAVTHDMIAAKLGINRTTVTKALKGDLSIKQLTRKKVIETATLMGYDFKQSQQNRREGKRYFVHEDVEFILIDRKNEMNQVRGRGRLTNLSSTGLLIKLDQTDTGSLPLAHLNIRIIPHPENPELKQVPVARVVRINFLNSLECAAKFDKENAVSKSVLEKIEHLSFDAVDKLAK